MIIMFDLNFLILVCMFLTFVHITAIITHFLLIYYSSIDRKKFLIQNIKTLILPRSNKWKK